MSTQPISNVAVNQRGSKADSSTIAGTAGAFPTVLGRILFSSIFLLAGPFHFSAADINAGIAAGVPVAKLLVPASGVLAVLGALSILLGYHAKLGAWALIVFLVPVTIMLHNFWATTDPATQQIQMVMFLKNVSLLGGALLITQFGSGPWSLDARQ